MEAKKGPRPRGLLRGIGSRGARGGGTTVAASPTANLQAVSASGDVASSTGTAQWKMDESFRTTSDRCASARGRRAFRGYPRSFRSADPSSDKSSGHVAVDVPAAAFDNARSRSYSSGNQRGSQRGRGARYPPGTWGGLPGRSDDQHWRQHDDRSDNDLLSAPIAETVAEVRNQPIQSAVEAHLSPAAPEFVPQLAGTSVTMASSPILGSYSFVAMSPSGQPVTMMLRPTPTPATFSIDGGALTPEQKAVMAAMAAVVPPKAVVAASVVDGVPRSTPSLANVPSATPRVPNRVTSETPLAPVQPVNESVQRAIAPSQPAPPENQPVLWKDRVPTAPIGANASVTARSGKTQPDASSASRRKVDKGSNCEGAVTETKLFSPRDKNPGFSRVTHRGIMEDSSGAPFVGASTNVATNAPTKTPTNAPAVGRRSHATTEASHDESGNRESISTFSQKSRKPSVGFAPAKRILSRGEKKHQRGFAASDNDFPALDKKMNELKLEAEARESAPITWRRSLEPNNNSENNLPPKFSYAARLKGVRVHIKSPPAVRGRTEEEADDEEKEVEREGKKTLKSTTQSPPSLGENVEEGPLTEAEETTTATKPKRRRRRRRRKAGEAATVRLEDNDEDVADDAGRNGGRNVVVEEGALKVKIDNADNGMTASTSSQPAKESAVPDLESEDIFQDDDFPDFLADFRRGLAAAAASATRKIPRVIGSKVTKLGAGRPLPKTVNEWTDVTSDEIKDGEDKGALNASSTTFKTADTGVASGAWGGAAARSFAEALKMATVAKAPMSDKSGATAKASEEEAPAKRKRKRKKKAKSDEAPPPPQAVKKSKAPLTFDLAALVPKKSENPPVKKKAPVKKNAPETVPGGIRLRGKEREKPKKKRPSKMKRVIMSERQLRIQRRELLLKLQVALHAPHAQYVGGQSSEAPVVSMPEKDDWLTTDAESDGGDDDDDDVNSPAANSDVGKGDKGEDVSNPAGLNKDVEVKSDIETLDRSQLEAKVAENLKELQGERIKHWGPKTLHNRKFREYCTHFVDAEINSLVRNLMFELMRFQDKIYHKEKEATVNMFKTKRRFFNGLREVLKYVKLKKIKLLLVASDVESIKSTGGLDDVMDQILQEAKSQRVFTVFTMSRFALGKILKKPVPVSCVGIKDFGGCESVVKELKKKVEEKTKEYEEKVEEIRAREEAMGGGEGGEVMDAKN